MLQVVTDEGTYFFDYLIVATGASYDSAFFSGNSSESIVAVNNGKDFCALTPTPATNVQNYRLKALADSAVLIEKAASIIIVGGGPVGTELAGEIAYKYPTKKLVMVHCHDRLLERLDPVISRRAQKYLEGKNVKVIPSLVTCLICLMIAFFRSFGFQRKRRHTRRARTQFH